jgi:hypothetical protein
VKFAVHNDDGEIMPAISNNQTAAIRFYSRPGIAELDESTLTQLFLRLKNIDQGKAVLRMLPNGLFSVDAPEKRNFRTGESDAVERRRATELFKGGNLPSVTVSSARTALQAALLKKSSHIPNVGAMSQELEKTLGAKASERAGDGRAIEKVFEIQRGMAPQPPVRQP